MSDPGWSNSWWGRDPIEQAGEDPMRRSDPIWDDDGPEFDNDPVEFEEDRRANEASAERMRRLNEAFAKDYEMLFNCLFGARRQ